MTAQDIAKIPKLALDVKQLGDMKWRVHGVHVEKLLGAGFARLDRMLEKDGILDFPVNEAGRSLIMRETILRDLMSGQRCLKTVPQSDAAAAQKDLVHLSLRQLLRLRAQNLDSALTGVHETLL